MPTSSELGPYAPERPTGSRRQHATQHYSTQQNAWRVAQPQTTTFRPNGPGAPDGPADPGSSDRFLPSARSRSARRPVPHIPMGPISSHLDSQGRASRISLTRSRPPTAELNLGFQTEPRTRSRRRVPKCRPCGDFGLVRLPLRVSAKLPAATPAARAPAAASSPPRALRTKDELQRL